MTTNSCCVRPKTFPKNTKHKTRIKHTICLIKIFGVFGNFLPHTVPFICLAQFTHGASSGAKCAIDAVRASVFCVCVFFLTLIRVVNKSKFFSHPFSLALSLHRPLHISLSPFFWCFFSVLYHLQFTLKSSRAQCCAKAL